MERVFIQILNMSFIGSIVISFILVGRLLLKKAPKNYSYILWTVPLIRLVIPFSFESMLSLIPVNPTPIPTDILYSPTPQLNMGLSRVDHVISNSIPATEVIASANSMQLGFCIGASIWIIGIAVLFIYGMTSFMKTKRKLEKSSCEKDNIYYSDTVGTPFVLGLIRPKIYLPTSLSESEKEYIVLHEQTHIIRLDHVTRFISYLVLCIHWFNPLVWIAYWLSGKDMEMSCDESVISQLGHDVKKDYSQSLLNLTTGRRQFRISPLAFGEGETKGRIKNILNFKQSKLYIIIGIMILLVAVIGLMTNPKSEENGNTDSPKSEDNNSTANSQIDEREVVAQKFLNKFYEASSEEVNKVAEYLLLVSSHNKTAEETMEYMVNYYHSLTAEYAEVTTQKEIDRLLSNRYLDSIRQLAYGNECTYEVKTISLNSDVEKENIIVYDYTITIESKKNNSDVVKTLEVIGKIRIDLVDQKYLVAYNDFGTLNSLIRDSRKVSGDVTNGYNESIGYISTFEIADTTSIIFDPIEWLTLDDTDRIKELEIKDYDMPNGYFINNPDIEAVVYEVADKVEYIFIDWGNDFTSSDEDRFHYSTTDKEEFAKYLATYSNKAINVPFRITTKDGVVQVIEEQYVP